MPSSKKILHFLASALATSASVSVIGYGMSAWWSVTEMECAAKNTGVYNGSAKVELGLFTCKLSKVSCPSFGNVESIEVLQVLANVGGAPVILHGFVIALLALSLLGSVGSILITLYNSVSNPYQTYMGPSGLYHCSSISSVLSLLALVLFVVNVQVVGTPQELIQNSVAVDLRNVRLALQVGFYLQIPYIVTSLLAILSVYLYEHMAYTQRKEQQRPTEDAPKEIMMY